MASLQCRTCRRTFSQNEKLWCCPCGGLVDVQFKPSFDLDKINSRAPNLWRYAEALPLEKEKNIVSFGEGFTPLIELDQDSQKVYAKLDYIFPTGSFKDRGATVLVSKMKELGLNHFVEDSSGNAGCALAAYAARAGMTCSIYIPHHTSPEKAAQIESFGARLVKIRGTREETAQAALQAAKNSYYASHVWNPFFIQGTKTIAYEICEQLSWKPPDTLVLPVGNGTLLLGAFIGFKELHQAGLIPKLPQVVAIQSAACSPLYHAFVGNSSPFDKAETTRTVAEGIAVAEPIRGPQIIEAVRVSQGKFFSVGEQEIERAVYTMNRRGFYVEPTAAVAIAGLERYLQQAPDKKLIVTVLTGTGFKAPQLVKQIVERYKDRTVH